MGPLFTSMIIARVIAMDNYIEPNALPLLRWGSSATVEPDLAKLAVWGSRIE